MSHPTPPSHYSALILCVFILTSESRNAEDYEPEDEDALQDDEDSDESFLDCLAACIHEIFKMYGVEFLPFFDQLLPAIDMFMVQFFLF